MTSVVPQVVPVYASRAFPGPDAAAFASEGDVELVRVERDYGAGNWTAFASETLPDALRAAGVRRSAAVESVD